MKTVKFKGMFGNTWYYGGAYNDGTTSYSYIIDKDGMHTTPFVLEYTGHNDVNGTEIYEDDLVACLFTKKVPYDNDYMNDTVDVEYLILFRVRRHEMGMFYAEMEYGGDDHFTYPTTFIFNNGRVVGNYHTCDDMSDLYDKLKEKVKNGVADNPSQNR